MNKKIGPEIVEKAVDAYNQEVLREETRRLNAAQYEESKRLYPFSFVLKHKKRGTIVEVAAVSDYHACTMLGWKPKHVIVLRKTDNKAPPVPSEVSAPLPSSSLM